MTAGETAKLEIVVNGVPTQAPAGCTVEGLLERMGVRADRVAVELDRRLVRREDWAETTLKGGARLEVVHFVGGG